MVTLAAYTILYGFDYVAVLFLGIGVVAASLFAVVTARSIAHAIAVDFERREHSKVEAGLGHRHAPQRQSSATAASGQ